MLRFLEYKNGKEAIERFRGKVLISQNYQNDPEMNFYIGDLMQLDCLIFALGEVESGESDFTLAGKEFLEYSFKNSDLEEKLTKEFYREDFISNFNDLNSYIGVKNNEIIGSRCFRIPTKMSIIKELAERLNIDTEFFYPLKMQKYDQVIIELSALFHSIFSDENWTPLRNFTVRFNPLNQEKIFYLYLFKSNYNLRFKPKIFIQDTSDSKGIMLNNSRQSNMISSSAWDLILDAEEEAFLKKANALFLELKSLIVKFSVLDLAANSSSLNQNNLLTEKISAGQLWDTISSLRSEKQRLDTNPWTGLAQDTLNNPL